MSNILNSEDFGLKLYNRFPPKYREDDVNQNFALKRYLQSLADGGFKHSIDEINGISDLIDPDRVDAKLLPILFKHYGLEIFNGIPEQYLRYLLPKLGEAWSKKGTLSVIEFITSSLSGIKTSTNVEYDDFDNPSVEIRFEMDYNLDGYFPNSEQFDKLLDNFIPFYCDKTILYTYMFYEYQRLTVKDNGDEYLFNDVVEDGGSFSLRNPFITETNALFGEAIFGKAVFGVLKDYLDTHIDNITDVKTVEEGILKIPVDTLTNKNYNLLNGSFFTNGASSYDIITIDGRTEVVF